METSELVRRAAIIILSAAVGEGAIEFVVVPILNIWVADNEANRPLRTVILNWCSALLGVGIALNFRLTLWGLLQAQGTVPVVAQALTGVLIGRGSNYIHGFVEKYLFKRPEP
jgi:hypothetical protein